MSRKGCCPCLSGSAPRQMQGVSISLVLLYASASRVSNNDLQFSGLALLYNMLCILFFLKFSLKSMLKAAIWVFTTGEFSVIQQLRKMKTWKISSLIPISSNSSDTVAISWLLIIEKEQRGKARHYRYVM